MLKGSKNINIAIVGTGGLGALIGYKLSKISNISVTAICRSNYHQVKEKGFQIKSLTWGEDSYTPEYIAKNVQEAANLGIEFDFVFVTLKNLPNIMDQNELIKPIVTNSTCIVLVQNGIDIEKPVYSVFTNNPLISVVAMVGVTQKNLGYIEHVYPLSLLYGNGRPQGEELSGDSTKVAELGAILQDAEITHSLQPDISIVRWFKVLWNASLGPISIVSGGLNCMQIHQDPHLRQLKYDHISEIHAFAKVVLKQDFPDSLPPSDPVTVGDRCSDIPYEASILVDYKNKSPIEIEVILGNLVRKADELQYPVPISRTMYGLLRRLDIINRGKDI